jgi:RimJ/RimL family protein N-acetyltransferase
MTETPVLTTERLVLRPLKHDDSKHLMYLLHPDIQKDAGPYMPHSIDDLSKHIERIRSDTTWLITVNEVKVIGDIGVFSKIGNATGEIAWYINPEYWQKGYATEAGFVVIHHLFSTLNFRKLTAPIEDKNIPSWQLAEKLGFSLEHIEYDTDLHGKRANVRLYCLYNPA